MKPYPLVRSLGIRNYKGIARLDIRLDDTLTLLAGVNGVGKTSAIEALLGAVTDVWSWLASDVEEAWFRPSGELLRHGAREGLIAIELAVEADATADVTIHVNAEELGHVNYSENDVLSRHLGEMSPLPLIVRYDQNRIGGMHSGTFRWTSQTNREAALDTTPGALSDFKNWYFEKESDEAREAIARNDLGYADPEVRAVQEVLKSIAGDSISLRSRKPDGSMDRMLFLTKEGQSDIPFEALSGGETAYFLLAVDLARRLLLEFPGSNLAEAPGFVCIDEIELHLHPAWQREILTALIDLFPRCQFVVTTHSPQVIGSVAARHVRLLSSDDAGNVSVTEPIASLGRDSNYVLAGIMDTPEQDPRVDDLFEKFDRLVDEGLLDEAGEVLDELDHLVEGQSSRVSLRRAKCSRLRRTLG
ncbi:MAG: AAA family ATPase [Boseongicola sp.]|nr:AAA family ATPase [Boseongicola sp.]